MASSASQFSRRQLLRLGSASILGLSFPHLLALQARAGTTNRAKAKNVIVILEQGGLSHIDTWDPKPEVVAEHRSAYKPIATKVAGMQFTELLPQTAKIADKLAVVRSMHHTKAGADGHPLGTKYVLSGSHPSSPLEMPDIGSVATHLLGTENKNLPPYIMVPGNHEQAAETRTGFLPAGTQVFKTGGKDLCAADWQVNDLSPRAENREQRLTSRRDLLSSLDTRFVANNRDVEGMSRFYAQAFDTLTSSQASGAFDYRREPAKIREQYGTGHRGACYLVGRRLIEAGVRFVTVDTRWPFDAKTLPGGTNLNWDHHDFIYAKGTCNLPGAGGGGAGRRGIGTWEMMGSTDQAFAALVLDLEQRGMLDETLVCFVTEFGRTPKLNKHQGRDHWTHAYSIAFAGAGVPGGRIIGASDDEGGYVALEPHTPEDYAMSVYEKLGIDRSKPLYTSTNRPVYFGHAGEVIEGLF